MTTALGWQLLSPPLSPPAETGLPRAAAEAIADAWWDTDPYLAAALMWEAYAASLPPEPIVSQVSTGVQSVSYSSPGGAFGLAMSRASWFRSMAGTLASVPLTLAPLPGRSEHVPFDAWSDEDERASVSTRERTRASLGRSRSRSRAVRGTWGI